MFWCRPVYVYSLYSALALASTDRQTDRQMNRQQDPTDNRWRGKQIRLMNSKTASRVKPVVCSRLYQWWWSFPWWQVVREREPERQTSSDSCTFSSPRSIYIYIYIQLAIWTWCACLWTLEIIKWNLFVCVFQFHCCVQSRMSPSFHKGAGLPCALWMYEYLLHLQSAYSSAPKFTNTAFLERKVIRYQLEYGK